MHLSFQLVNKPGPSWSLGRASLARGFFSKARKVNADAGVCPFALPTSSFEAIRVFLRLQNSRRIELSQKTEDTLGFSLGQLKIPFFGLVKRSLKEISASLPERVMRHHLSALLLLTWGAPSGASRDTRARWIPFCLSRAFLNGINPKRVRDPRGCAYHYIIHRRQAW